MSVQETSEQTWSFCTECGRSTRHDVVAEHKASGYAEGPGIHWTQTHQIVRCRGCETVGFQRESWDSDSYDWNDNEPIVSLERFPPAFTDRNSMKGTEYFPDDIESLYDEALTVFNAGARRLAAAGLRATVEAVCKEQGCDAANLKQRIQQLVHNGSLSTTQADYLHMHRYMGNDAVHEMEAPVQQELSIALDVLESLLGTLYVLPAKADRIESSRARRGAQSLRRVNREP